jgi:pyruvate/2-oxoglutarate dehydrogenase complex dihydrolipoamide dehydrogenase (E3) component
MKRQHWMWVGLAAMALLVAGCTGCTPTKAYIEADRATHEAVAPEYLELVRESGKFDAKQIQRRQDTIDTWR